MLKNKNYDYFNSFVVQTNYAYQSSKLLHEIVKQFNPKLMPTHLTQMHDIAHSADLSKHEMMRQLTKEFIAPIEREDIVRLAQILDKVTDDIEDVLIAIHMYNINRMKPETTKFTSLIMVCCSTLLIVMKEFHNFKKSTMISSKLIEINRLEEQCDTLYYDTVHQLYLNTTNPIELSIWSSVYEKLERCTDSCEHVADLLESIIMKNT